MKSKMNTLLMTLICSLVLGINTFSQTVTFAFEVQDGLGNVLGSVSYSGGPTNPGNLDLTIDLRSAGVCAGDEIFIQNNSSGYLYSNTPANTISPTTGWDFVRGRHVTGTTWSFCNEWILGGSTIPPEVWSPNPIPVVLPHPAGCIEDIMGDHYTQCYIVSPDIYYYGEVSTAACEQAIELRLIINKPPLCLDDLVLCPSMKPNYISQAINDHIPTDVNAYDWSPFDPTMTSFEETTTFSVTLANTSGQACPIDCEFDIIFEEPDYPIANDAVICESNAPYIGGNPFLGLDIHSISINGTVIFSDTQFDPSYFPNDVLTLTDPGTYQIEQFFEFDGGELCSTTYTVTILEHPIINMSNQYEFCNENFQEICGPSGSSTIFLDYSWYFNNPVTMTSELVSNSMCYTPDQYGSYTLVVCNQYGCCSNHTFEVVEGFGPDIAIEDVYYCKKGAPEFVGLVGPYADALQYEWTYEGTGGLPDAYQIPYQGDGEYCLTIYWSDANVPSLLGCTSTTCFVVERCCAPNTEFVLTFDATGSTASITVENNPANTPEYDSEEFVLYKYCGTETDLSLVTWTYVASSGVRTTNFNDPVEFTGLDNDCIYKVVHRVNKDCKQKTYVSEIIAGQLKINMYPNPLDSGSPVTIEMSVPSPEATVNIFDLVSGDLVFTGRLSYETPLTIDYEVLKSGRGSRSLSVVVSNEIETITSTLIVN